MEKVQEGVEPVSAPQEPEGEAVSAARMEERVEPVTTSQELEGEAVSAARVEERVEPVASPPQEPEMKEKPLEEPEGEPVSVEVEAETAPEQTETEKPRESKVAEPPASGPARPAPSSRPPPPPRTSSLSSLSRGKELTVTSPPLETVQDTTEQEAEASVFTPSPQHTEEAVSGEGGLLEVREDVGGEGPAGDTQVDVLSEGGIMPEEGVGSESKADQELEEELATGDTCEAAQEVEVESESPDEVVKSKYPTTSPGKVPIRELSPSSFGEEILPPPHVPLTDEVSPPPEFTQEVSPPPLFADDAPPTPEGVLMPPPPPEGVPMPPPPPPIPPEAPQAVQRGAGAAPPLRVPSPDSAMAQTMAAIRDGGVALRKVPPPVVHAVGEEKVVDVASELRAKLGQRRKEEVRGRDFCRA